MVGLLLVVSVDWRRVEELLAVPETPRSVFAAAEVQPNFNTPATLFLPKDAKEKARAPGVRSWRLAKHSIQHNRMEIFRATDDASDGGIQVVVRG